MVPRTETASPGFATPTRPAASRTLFDNLVHEIDFELGGLQGAEDDLIPLEPIGHRNENGRLRPADAPSPEQDADGSFDDPYSDLRLIPFVGEDTEDEPLYVAMEDSSGRGEPFPGAVEGDPSETEDLIVAAAAPEAILPAAPAVEANASTPEDPLNTAPTLPLPGEITRIALGTQRPAPRKIGRGRLVPARLTWKPGDPFGGVKSAPGKRFRWELMLTTACGTAVCGMICLALMRMVLS